MNALVPAPAINNFRREVDRLFDRLWEDDWKEVAALGEWAPPLEMIETMDAFTVHAEVPGIEPRDVHVSLKDNILTIRGEKKFVREAKDEDLYRTERRFGAFTRIVNLPMGVDPSKVNATFRNGVLTVVLQKLPGARSMEIPIKMG